MDYFVEPIIVDTEGLEPPSEGCNIYESRKNVLSRYKMYFPLQASIVITCFNRLEKSKRCIENVLRYTEDVDFELILIDNGSSDGTYEYLQSVPHKNKKIIKITKNFGVATTAVPIYRIYSGKYLVFVANDIVVTKNWLSNIIKCYESDPRIGFVVPISTNVSNLQEVSMKFTSDDQIQQFGEKNNIHDPKRWEERPRLVSVLSVLKREIIDIVGTFDYGFYHDFGEDDFSLRIRRAGYKLILCHDSFIHHDHDFRNMEDKNPDEFRKSLESGRKSYNDKYHGLDPWDDVNNYERNLINMLHDSIQKVDYIPNILGIDIRMGTPILEIRNKLRSQGILNSNSFAFTTEAKYYTDLQTICNQTVSCDRIDYIFEHYAPETFDYIVLGEPVNSYAQPVKLLQRLIEFAKPEGQILIKIKNINNVSKLVQILGGDNYIDDSMFVNIEPRELIDCAKIIGISSFSLLPEIMSIEKDTEEALKNILKNANVSKDVVETTQKLEVENYLICLCK